MRRLLIIFCALFSVHASGQIRVRILVKDACVDSLTPATGYIYNEHFMPPHLSELDEKGEVILEQGKEYCISGSYIRSGMCERLIIFNFIADAPLDTLITIPKVAPFRTRPGLNSPLKYYNCKKLCRGHCTDYYKDGRLRMEGRFSKGIPKGELKFYYPNGNLKRSDRFERHKIMAGINYDLRESKLFYENGTVRKVFRYSSDGVTEVILYDKNGAVYFHEQYEPSLGPVNMTYKWELEDDAYNYDYP